jgi:hypothetical protein
MVANHWFEFEVHNAHSTFGMLAMSIKERMLPKQEWKQVGLARHSIVRDEEPLSGAFGMGHIGIQGIVKEDGDATRAAAGRKVRVTRIDQTE